MLQIRNTHKIFVLMRVCEFLLQNPLDDLGSKENLVNFLSCEYKVKTCKHFNKQQNDIHFYKE